MEPQAEAYRVELERKQNSYIRVTHTKNKYTLIEMKTAHSFDSTHTCTALITHTDTSMVIYSKVISISTRTFVTTNAVSTEVVTPTIAGSAFIHIY